MLRASALSLSLALAACTVTPTPPPVAPAPSASTGVVLRADRDAVELSRSEFLTQSVVVTVTCSEFCESGLVARVTPDQVATVEGPTPVEGAPDRVTFTVSVSTDTPSDIATLIVEGAGVETLTLPIRVGA